MLNKHENIQAAFFATVIAFIFIVSSVVYSHIIICDHIQTLAPEFYDSKLHGSAAIKQAFHNKKTLVMLGSSELLFDVPYRGVEFFNNSPTGFNLFPIGKAGTTSLSLIQKLGSCYNDIESKKLVISLSPGFFLQKEIDKNYIIGNSSTLQIKKFLLSNCDNKLKIRFIQRLKQYPEIYTEDWCLKSLISCVEGNYWYKPIIGFYYINLCFVLAQDYIETAHQILHTHIAEVKFTKTQIVWSELLSAATKTSLRSSKAVTTNTKQRNNKEFVQSVQHAIEWDDFDLLLDILRSLKIKPLIISMPIHRDILSAQGVTIEAQATYKKKLKKLATDNSYNIVYLEQYENDPTFFIDDFDHLSSKGWVIYNQLINTYFHTRL